LLLRLDEGRADPPRFADRNGDGLPDVFIQAQAGNSLFFTEIWQWNARRARLLWTSSGTAVRLLESRTGLVANGPIATAFPDEDGDGVHDIVETFAIGRCRTCEPVKEVGLRYRYRPPVGSGPSWALRVCRHPIPVRRGGSPSIRRVRTSFDDFPVALAACGLLFATEGYDDSGASGPGHARRP
jgi:hypothetical protein